MTTKEQRALTSFKKKLQERICVTEFPIQELYSGFLGWFNKAKVLTSIRKSGCTEDTWVKLMTLEGVFYLHEVDLMIQFIRSTTPNEFNQTSQENVNMLLNDVKPVFLKWEEIRNKLADDILTEVNAECKTKLTFKGSDIEREQVTDAL